MINNAAIQYSYRLMTAIKCQLTVVHVIVVTRFRLQSYKMFRVSPSLHIVKNRRSLVDKASQIVYLVWLVINIHSSLSFQLTPVSS